MDPVMISPEDTVSVLGLINGMFTTKKMELEEYVPIMTTMGDF